MIFCIVLRLFICCSEVIYLLSNIFIKSFLCLMYHMAGFYSFPYPISQILDIAPRSSNLGAISKDIAPQVGIFVVFGTSIY